MTRLGTVLRLSKQAAAAASIRAQLQDWERQFAEPLIYGESARAVSPEIKEQLQSALPGTDVETAPRPSRWPALLAVAGLLSLGGAAYLATRPEGKGKPR